MASVLTKPPAAPPRQRSGRRRALVPLLAATLVSVRGGWRQHPAAASRRGQAFTLPAPERGDAYVLHARRAILHLCIVPEPAPASYGIPGPALPDSVRPLSVLGRTVGGSFFVDWDGSPWGSYQEVGLLSSLVAAASDLLSWGGWASHVWVNSDDALQGGRRIWGLPTSSCKIDVEEAGPDGTVLAFGTAPLVSIGDGVGPLGRIDTFAKITVGNVPWPATDDEAPAGDGVSLPNLSGCLPTADDEDVAAGLDCRNLLSYPIKLRPRSMRMLSGAKPDGGMGVVPRVDFSDWWPLFSVELRDVEVEVGVPKTVAAR